jgi:hypothetical protein
VRREDGTDAREGAEEEEEEGRERATRRDQILN